MLSRAGVAAVQEDQAVERLSSLGAAGRLRPQKKRGLRMT